MSIKVYTYENPMDLDKSDKWEEIKNIPHLCVSETLVNGLKSTYQRRSFNEITTIDRFLNKFYEIWLNDIQYDIKQYLMISKEIDKIEDEKIKTSFRFNQKEVHKSIKTLKELHVEFKKTTYDSLDKKYFIEIYNNLKNSECFNRIDLLKNIDMDMYNSCFKEILKEEIINILEQGNKLEEDFKILKSISNEDLEILIDNYLKNNASEPKVNSLLRNKNNSKNSRSNELKHLKELYFEDRKSFRKIIIHGVHRFTPIIMHFIDKLQNMGIEIIFLINYWDEYSEVYQTWKNVYSWIDNVQFETITKKKNYDVLDYNTLGLSIGNILEGNFKEIYSANLENFKINEYSNITAFSNSISKEYEDALNKNIDEFNKSSVISNMSTQYYAVNNSEVNEILRVYYPKQFGDKHFLSYPVGQFILAIYNMWDLDKHTINIDEKNIKECLMFFNLDLLSTYERTSLYFSDLKDIKDIKNRLNLLIENIKLIKCSSNSSIDKYFTKMVFFDVDIVEIKRLIEVLDNIFAISKDIFSDIKSHNQEISYIKHYENLIDILSNKITQYGLEPLENEFIEDIKNKLNSQSETDNIEGSAYDLKETIHFYLNKSDENESSSWIVRNFEQIDGGILLSDKSKSNYYHYCLLSDRNMKPKPNDFLSWPLNFELFNEATFDNINLKIVLNSFNEYKNFLRYSLFYGITFCKKNVEISYIKDCGEDDFERPYFLFNILNLKTVVKDLNKNSFNKEYEKVEERSRKVGKIYASDEELKFNAICSYRYLLNSLIEPNFTYNSNFQIRYFTILLLTFKLLENQYSEKDNINFIKKILPFYSTSDINDIMNKANFDKNNMKINGSPVDEIYMKDKINFLLLKITKNYNKNQQEDDKENLLKKIFYNDLQLTDIKKYLNNYSISETNEDYSVGETNDNYSVSETNDNYIDPVICEYCNQKELCLNYYREDI